MTPPIHKNDDAAGCTGKPGQCGGGACCCAGQSPQAKHPAASAVPAKATNKRVSAKPLNNIPLRCGAEPKNFCGCNQNQAEFKKRLSNKGGVKFCTDGLCDTPCAASRRQPHDQICAPAAHHNNDHHDHNQSHKRISDDHYHNGPNHHRTSHRRSSDKNNRKRSGHHHKKHSASSSDDSCCCYCEHGVRFSDCRSSSPSPPPPPPRPPPPVTHIIERQKPVITVHNKELCACESKWKLIERWQAAARKRESKKQEEEDSHHKEREKERIKKREEAKVRHREFLMMQKELDARRRKEEDDWRRSRYCMEERRLEQEYEMWLEDLLEEEANRLAKQEKQRRKEARLWREEQKRPWPKTAAEEAGGEAAIPELEELRRVLAPIDQGPNEIFEYFAVEPKQQHESPREVAKALMGMRCSDGIHIQLGDQQEKRATLRVNMGPCQGSGNNNGLVPPEVIQMMMKIKEATNNPCLRFNQTSPPWTTMQGQISLPPQVAPTLAPFYGSPGPQQAQDPYSSFCAQQSQQPPSC